MDTLNAGQLSKKNSRESMDTLNVGQLSKKNSGESDVPSTDERDSSPTRKSSKAKQKRRALTVSSRDHGKSKSRTSKDRQSMTQTTQEMNDALSFAKKFDLKSTNDDHDEAGDHLAKLTLDEKNETENLQQNQAARHSIGTFNMIPIDKPNGMQDSDEKDVLLKNRLENNTEFDIIGILNLSGMNLTDNDLPSVIQRAFLAGPKKCTGLILRNNALTADGVRMIVDTIIAGRTHLKHLSFASNPDIGDAGVEHIVRLLQINQSISFLALPGTGMTDRGVRLLADVLCGADPESTIPSPLEKLYISFNQAITDESLEPFLQILEQNRKLKVLSLEHCSLSDRAHEILRQAAIKLKKKKFSLTG